MCAFLNFICVHLAHSLTLKESKASVRRDVDQNRGDLNGIGSLFGAEIDQRQPSQSPLPPL